MKKNYLILHLSFLLMSFPALFAKGINIPAGMLVWWRCLIGALITFAILLITKKVRVSKTELKWLLITGVLMGLHWWTYFLAIQLSTVAIGVLALFTYPIISVMLEPFFFGTKVSLKQVIGGVGIVSGVYFLIPEFSLSNTTTMGVMVGIACAFIFSLRNILTRKHLSNVPAVTTMGYHILCAFLLLSLPLLANTDQFVIPTWQEAGLITILASVFTLGSHGLVVYSLKYFTVSTIGILGGLQVVYGTILAYLFFNEVPNINFYLGAFIILSISIFEMLPANKASVTKS